MYKMLGINQKIWQRVRNTLFWGAILLATSFSASLVMYEIERAAGNVDLDSLFDTYWWWVNTVTGLGATAEPLTIQGKAIATFIIFTGFVLLGLLISDLSAIFKMVYSRNEKGNIQIGFRKHIVIFGYTSLTAGIIKLLRKHFGTNVRIVLISNEIDSNPFPGQVSFIHDNPISRETFLNANIAKAAAAIILANDRFRDPDTYSLAIATGIERQNSEVVSIVEIVDPKSRDLFKLTSIDAFIDRRETLIDLLENNPNPKLKRIILKQSSLEEKLNSTAKTDLI